jgi:hypothetical protein
MELGSEQSRSKDGIKIARDGDAAVLKRPLRFALRRLVIRACPQRGRWSSWVTVSTWTLRGHATARAGAPMHPLRSRLGGYPK